MGDHAGHGQIRSRDLKAAILALLLVGCSAQQTSSTPLPVAPTPTPGAPSIQFTFDGEEPSVTRELTGIDEAFINPGAVIADPDRTLHMFANVFTAWPGPVSVPHLTSTDGVSWAPAQPEPILTADDVPLADPGFDVSTGFIADDGTWVLIYQTVSTDPWRLGRITAPGPDGPWMVDGEPMLEPGPEGSIDAGGLSWPSIVRTDAGYLLYYTARTEPSATADGAIAVATSTDGLVWERRADPVLVADQDWEVGSVDRPRAAATDDGIVMVYSGRQLTDRGVAWSDDGLTWRKDGAAPAITAADFPVAGGAWDAALIAEAGQLVYFLEIGGGTPTTGTLVYRAVAPVP
jgi:predicted GH43/DUF377 family glycosyl hydrolase